MVSRAIPDLAGGNEMPAHVSTVAVLMVPMRTHTSPKKRQPPKTPHQNLTGFCNSLQSAGINLICNQQVGKM